MICENCYNNWKAIIYDGYHYKTRLIGGCHLYTTPTFNLDTYEYECEYFIKEEKNTNESGFGHYEIIKPIKVKKNGK